MPFPARIKVYKRGNSLFGQNVDVLTGADVGQMYELSPQMIGMGLTAVGTYTINAAGTAYIPMIQVI